MQTPFFIINSYQPSILCTHKAKAIAWQHNGIFHHSFPPPHNIPSLHFLLVTVTCHNTQTTSLHPIGKDPKTNLFYTSLALGTPRHDMDLVIDLGGPILWNGCDNHYNSSSYNPVHCESKKCPAGSACTGCNGPFKPGCSNDTCGAYILNPFADAIFSGDLGDDVLFLSHTSLSLSGLISGFTSIDDTSLLNNLPKSGKGILGLARTQLAFQT